MMDWDGLWLLLFGLFGATAVHTDVGLAALVAAYVCLMGVGKARAARRATRRATAKKNAARLVMALLATAVLALNGPTAELWHRVFTVAVLWAVWGKTRTPPPGNAL